MSARVITPPAAVVDLDTAKAHLNVEHPDHDHLIELYVQAATATIDGPGGWLGRALGVQTLEARFDAFACELVKLPCPPLISIGSVAYDDGDGVEQTLDEDQYTLDPEGLLLAYEASWPNTRTQRGAVRVTYDAGYEDGIPGPITAAILLMTGDLYANRETAVVGTVAAKVPMSTTVENLLSPFRVWES